MTENRPLRILRAIAASPHGLAAPGLVAELAEGIEPHQKALAWYGTILRAHAGNGLIARAGKTEGGWQRCPAFIYRITGEGLARLAHIDDEPNRKAAHDKALAQAEEASERRHAALAEAGRVYSRATPRDDRRTAALQLRNLGCSLEEIGGIFGVTREMIRQDLLPADPRPARVAGLAMGDLMSVRVGKRTLTFTRAEARILADFAAEFLADA